MQKEIDVLINHVDTLKRMPAFRAAHIRLILEANSGWVRSRDIYQAMLAYKRFGVDNVKTLCTNEKNGGQLGKRIGFWLPPDPEHKYRLALHFKSILETGRLRILDKFVSKNENAMDILKNQLSSFELIPRPNQTKNDYAPRRFEVSGKRGGKKDDVMMSLIEVAFYSAVIWFEPHLSTPFQAKRLWTIEKFKEAAPDIYRRQIETLYVR